MRTRAAIALGAALALAGCGYAPVRRTQAKALKVAAVRNDTAQAEAGGIFASELRTELSDRGRLDADGSPSPELQAELLSLTSFTTAAGSEGGAAFRLEAKLRVRAPSFEDVIVGSEDYLAGIDVLGTEANRRAALRRVARSVAHEAIERLEVAEHYSRSK